MFNKIFSNKRKELSLFNDNDIEKTKLILENQRAEIYGSMKEELDKLKAEKFCLSKSLGMEFVYENDTLALVSNSGHRIHLINGEFVPDKSMPKNIEFEQHLIDAYREKFEAIAKLSLILAPKEKQINDINNKIRTLNLASDFDHKNTQKLYNKNIKLTEKLVSKYSGELFEQSGIYDITKYLPKNSITAEKYKAIYGKVDVDKRIILAICLTKKYNWIVYSRDSLKNHEEEKIIFNNKKILDEIARCYKEIDVVNLNYKNLEQNRVNLYEMAKNIIIETQTNYYDEFAETEKVR